MLEHNFRSGKNKVPTELKDQKVFKIQENLLEIFDGAPWSRATTMEKRLKQYDLVVKALMHPNLVLRKPTLKCSGAVSFLRAQCNYSVQLRSRN